MASPENDRCALTEEEREYYSLSARVYPVFAPFYDVVTFPFRSLRRTVASLADLGRSARVLDVATGTGEQALAFAERAGEVVGVDQSQAMLRIARRKSRLSKLSFLQADATALPFADEAFDLSCVSFALHEMPASIRARVVREMARITRQGGSVVIVDYALPRGRIASWVVYHGVKLFERDHYASFVRCDLDSLLESAGIGPAKHHRALAGAARISIGRKTEALARAEEDPRRTSP